MTTVSSTSSTTTAASTGYTALQASDSGTGIDYSSLIEAAVAARLAPADKIDQKITDNEAKISAYEKLQSYLNAMDTALDGLRNRSESTGSSDNLFNQRTAYLSGGGDMSADDVLAVTADDGVETGTHTFEVEQIATYHKIGSGTETSQTDALGLSGTVTLGLEGGTTASVTIGADDSLSDIKDAINAQSSTSGVKASILKVSDTDYQLILTATDTGKEITMSDDDSGVLTGLGLTNSDGSYANELVAAQDAKVVIDGVEVTRSSNTIDDAIEGLTINLYAADPDNTISAEISTDLSSIKTAITNFVSAYNDYASFVDDQQSTNSDGTAADGATLFSDSILRQVEKSISDITARTVKSSDGDTLSLSSIGITINEDGTMEVDEDTLNEALTDNLDDVQKLLGLNMTSSSSDLSLLRYKGTQSSLDFDLDIDVGEDGTINSASVNGDSSLFTVKGNRITGNDGTAYAGIVLVYTGDTDTVHVNFSQGIADQFYNTVDAVSDTSTGSIASVIDQIEDTDKDLSTQSDTIKDQAEDYRTTLTAYYARLEAKAQTANLLLQQLQYKSDSSDS